MASRDGYNRPVMRYLAAAVTVVLTLLYASIGNAQGIQKPAPLPVDYAAFMRLNNDQRLRAFNRLTVEQQTGLMLDHLSRWLVVHRNDLAPEQSQALRNWINVVAPRRFRVPGYKDTHVWQDEVVAQIETLLSPAQIRQALTIYGDYIPQPLPARTP